MSVTVLTKTKWLQAMGDNNLVSKSINADYGTYKSYVLNGTWDESRLHGSHRVNRNESAITIDRPMSLEGRIASKFIQLEKSAFNRGFDFNLTLSEVRKLVKRKTCFYTGVKLSNGDNADDRTRRTIDRLNPQKGYVIGNVVACSSFANQLKERFEHDISSGFCTKKGLSKLVELMIEAI